MLRAALAGEILHALRDVEGVIAETLVEPGDERHLERRFEGQLTALEQRGELVVQCVELVVERVDLRRRRAVTIDVRIRGRPPHRHAEVSHSFDVTPDRRRALTADTW